jgi:spore coat polysaccharide biosynthesis protein SpsF (cytidylyltransferase family)
MTSSFRVVAIIQARMTSKRLPGKVMAELDGRPVLEQIVRRVKRSETIDRIVIATTTNKDDDVIEEMGNRLGVLVYRGDEHDVLGRYYQVAKSETANAVVRITGDCPLIDPEIIDNVVSVFRSGCYDYVSNCNDRTYPDGLDVEVFSYESLVEANQYGVDSYSREHVTPYLRGEEFSRVYGNFRIYQVKFQSDLSHVRWTLDTEDDLVRIRALYKVLPDSFSWLEALSIATKNPRLLGVEQK